MLRHRVVGFVGLAITIAALVALHQFFKFMGMDFVLGGLFMCFVYQFGHYAAHGKWIEFD